MKNQKGLVFALVAVVVVVIAAFYASTNGDFFTGSLYGVSNIQNTSKNLNNSQTTNSSQLSSDMASLTGSALPSPNEIVSSTAPDDLPNNVEVARFTLTPVTSALVFKNNQGLNLAIKAYNYQSSGKLKCQLLEEGGPNVGSVNTTPSIINGNAEVLMPFNGGGINYALASSTTFVINCDVGDFIKLDAPGSISFGITGATWTDFTSGVAQTSTFPTMLKGVNFAEI